MGCRIAYKWNVLFPKLSHLAPRMKQIQKISYFESNLLLNCGQQERAYQKMRTSWPGFCHPKKKILGNGKIGLLCLWVWMWAAWKAHILESSLIPGNCGPNRCKAAVDSHHLWYAIQEVSRSCPRRALSQTTRSSHSGSWPWQPQTWFESWVSGSLPRIVTSKLEAVTIIVGGCLEK